MKGYSVCVIPEKLLVSKPTIAPEIAGEINRARELSIFLTTTKCRLREAGLYDRVTLKTHCYVVEIAKTSTVAQKILELDSRKLAKGSLDRRIEIRSFWTEA